MANILAADSAEPVHDRGRQRAERVLTGWWTDPSFQDTTTGGPAILAVRGGRRSFAALVDRYSGERWRIATILEELLRVKAVRRLSDGRLEALSRTYATVRWDPDGVIAFGEHVAELTATLLHNLKYPARARFVRRVVNARLDPRYVPMLRRDLELQAEALVDSQGEALNDSLHTLKGKRGEPEPASLGFTVYVFELQDDDTSAGRGCHDEGRRSKEAETQAIGNGCVWRALRELALKTADPGGGSQTFVPLRQGRSLNNERKASCSTKRVARRGR